MAYDPTDLAAQEVEQKSKALVARLDRETEEADITWLMGSRRGRRILWRLMDQAGVFKSSFNPTAMQMAFNEGNRNYGNRVLATIHTYCPELYPLMVKEQSNGNGKPDGSSRPAQ